MHKQQAVPYYSEEDKKSTLSVQLDSGSHVSFFFSITIITILGIFDNDYAVLVSGGSTDSAPVF